MQLADIGLDAYPHIQLIASIEANRGRGSGPAIATQ